MKPLLHELKAAGLLLIVTTNQPGLSRGYQSRRELDRMHQLLRGAFPLDDLLERGTLQSGRLYTWSLEVPGQAETRVTALLRLLTLEEEQAIQELETQAAAEQRAQPGNPAPLLVLAEGYERVGLFDDAAAAYRDVLRLRPGNHAVAAALKAIGR